MAEQLFRLRDYWLSLGIMIVMTAITTVACRSHAKVNAHYSENGASDQVHMQRNGQLS